MGNLLEILFVLLLILAFFFFLAFCWKTYTKKHIADNFAVSKKTIGKWVELFPNSLSKDWSSLKVIDGTDFYLLQLQWESEGYRSMNKQEICIKCGSDYQTLSANVRMNLKKIGISLTAWKSLSIFPPAVCERILSVMG